MIFVRAGFQYYTGQVIENTYLLQMSIIILTWDQAFKDMQQVIDNLILVKKTHTNFGVCLLVAAQQSTTCTTSEQ